MSNITSLLDGDAGSAQGRVGTTVQTLAISLAAGFILFVVQFGTFLIVRNYLWSKRIYQPRSFLVPLKNRIKPPPNNPLKWILTVFKTPDDPEVLRKAGMDAYFFIRYLSMCLKIFFPMALVIIPILIPLNFKDGKGTNDIGGTRYNVTGLDTLTWSNVSPRHTSRYWAHLILAIGVVIWVCVIFHWELTHYISKRYEFLSSRSHRLKASSTTVLITDIPDEVCTVEALTELYEDFPGGIRRIWINRDFTPLVNKAEARNYFEKLLENAETNMIRRAIKRHRHMLKREEKGAMRQLNSTDGTIPADKATLENSPESSLENADSALGTTSQVVRRDPTTPEDCQSDLRHDVASRAIWTTYIKPTQRETMRIPKGNHTYMSKIPLISWLFSTKVDTIYYCRRELGRLNEEIEAEIENSESYSSNRSAFIQFNSPKAAHLACQSIADFMPRQMAQRLIEISPADINWSNLGLPWKSRYIRFVTFFFVFILLIFAFGLISFFTGILSRISTLADSTNWLRWIGTLPKWLLSFIQGTLPPVIQVILLSGPLPIILRALTNHMKGSTTGSEGERSLQLWYFIFLLIEVFIIPTISSGLTSVVQDILHDPFGSSIPQILATNLPTAANYYFSFLVLQAFSISSSSILQTIRLLNYYILGSVNTPDSVFQKLSFTHLTRIGSNIPWYTTFVVVGLVYSIIAPLVLVFMIITFSLFWIVIKNNLLYVVRTGNVDGGALFFPSAINQTFTGLYFMEICLIGLFFLVRDVDSNVACEAQGVLMSLTLLLTICYQLWLLTNFHGLHKYAPVRLEAEAARRDKECETENLNSSLQPSTLAADDTLAPRIESLSHNMSENGKPSIAETERKEEADNTKITQDLRPRRPRTFSQTSELTQAQQRQDRQSAKRILARLHRPLDERRLAELENALVRAERRAGNILVPRHKDIERQMMDDPISKIIMQHNDELEDIDADERDMLISVAFTHPILREPRPSVWIPSDDLGLSDDEIRRTRQLSQGVSIDNRGAFFNKRLQVRVNKPPPDMSEFALVMSEL